MYRARKGRKNPLDLGSKKLARRLLFGTSANDDHEMSTLCNVVVTDFQLAKGNQSEFEEFQKSNAHVHPGIDLTVTVLTTSHRKCKIGFLGAYNEDIFLLGDDNKMITAVACSPKLRPGYGHQFLFI
ncbi:hypothetical protein MKX03_016162 [Papaver bracteatum]|nr:hypothetical protein MKX03_016162 [Papaver bracteatum]